MTKIRKIRILDLCTWQDATSARGLWGVRARRRKEASGLTARLISEPINVINNKGTNVELQY